MLVNESKLVLEDTGERMIPDIHDGNLIYGEHLARYEFVLELIKGKSVLDIASGSGYGSYLMAKHAKSVKGVDISKEAINYASNKYSCKNLQFIVGNASTIPFEDNKFDIVTSFETLEHIDEDQAKFISEIKRVLKPGGLLIISTPNDKVVPPGNHYHVHELNLQQFSKLVSKYFKKVDVYYQAVSLASYIFNTKTFENKDLQKIYSSRKYIMDTKDSTYFIALCSNNELPEGQPLITLSEDWRHIDKKNNFDYKQKIEKENINLLQENHKLKSELEEIKKSKIYWMLKKKIKKYNE